MRHTSQAHDGRLVLPDGSAKDSVWVYPTLSPSQLFPNDGSWEHFAEKQASRALAFDSYRFHAFKSHRRFEHSLAELPPPS